MIQINGEEKADYDGMSLAAVVAGEGYEISRIAVERNGEIIPKAAYEKTILKAGDTLEVVSFVGGG